MARYCNACTGTLPKSLCSACLVGLLVLGSSDAVPFAVFSQHETRHSRQPSSGISGPAPPVVMPKPSREVKRAKSADNLLGDGSSAPSTPHRVHGGVQLLPVFPGVPPLKKSLSGNSLDPDTDRSHQPAVEVEQIDGTSSGKSSPSKSGLESRPGSAKGTYVGK